MSDPASLHDRRPNNPGFSREVAPPVGGTSIAVDWRTDMFESHRATRDCPRCQRPRAQYLRSMRKHSALDWFKCDACDHIFSDAGTYSAQAPAALDKKPPTAA